MGDHAPATASPLRGPVPQKAQKPRGMAPYDGGVPVGTLEAPSVAAAAAAAKNSKVAPKLRYRPLQVEEKALGEQSPSGSAAPSPLLTGKTANRHHAEFKIDCGSKAFKHLSLEKVTLRQCVCMQRRRPDADMRRLCPTGGV